jgi:hypothetical protein
MKKAEHWEDVLVLQMLSYLNLYFKVLLDVALYQLRFVKVLKGDYVFGLSFTSEVDVTKFSSTQGLADFEVVD